MRLNLELGREACGRFQEVSLSFSSSRSDDDMMCAY
jgi:hypothetical protein